MYTTIYILLIVLVNYLFTVLPMIPLPTGGMFPVASVVVGLVFVARDFAQKEISHKVVLAMLVAAGLSYFMASPFVALASLVAFLISEFADWSVYTWTKKPFAQRILISSAVSTPLDSAVFLAMIGHFSVSGVIIMTLSKMIGALVVWQIVRRKA
tara:strand:- start:1181 stop:1645 length:465 start_codon:yes stop_codon:yes gene_type:complete